MIVSTLLSTAAACNPCVQVMNAKVVHLDTFGRARGMPLMLKSPCLHSRLSTALTALGSCKPLNKGIEPQCSWMR